MASESHVTMDYRNYSEWGLVCLRHSPPSQRLNSTYCGYIHCSALPLRQSSDGAEPLERGTSTSAPLQELVLLTALQWYCQYMWICFLHFLVIKVLLYVINQFKLAILTDFVVNSYWGHSQHLLASEPSDKDTLEAFPETFVHILTAKPSDFWTLLWPSHSFQWPSDIDTFVPIISFQRPSDIDTSVPLTSFQRPSDKTLLCPWSAISGLVIRHFYALDQKSAA